MSIVRVSAMKGAIHGVSAIGDFEHAHYDRRSGLGRTESFTERDEPTADMPDINTGDILDWRGLDRRGFPRPSSDLYHLLSRQFQTATKDLTPDKPVVVMVHGFLFDPRFATSREPQYSDNPHSRLYHFVVRPKAREVKHHTTGWPLRLGFSEADTTGQDGMVVAFGWHSKPGFAKSLTKAGKNFYAHAYDNAEKAAWNLLTVLHVLEHFLAPEHRINLFCHSLGSRVIVRAIALAAKHRRLDLLDRIERAIILGGAEYVLEARHMLRRLRDVGRLNTIRFFNVVSRENDVLDKLGENFGPDFFGNTNVIGHNGLDVENPENLGQNWVDMQIDGSKFRDWILTNRGHTVTGDNPDSVWDHWYYFTDPDNMAVYRDIIRHDPVQDPLRWDIAALRQAGMPDRVSRRRSVWGD